MTIRTFRGAGHINRLLVAIAAFGIAVTGAGLAAVSANPANWTEVGSVPIAGSQDNQVVTAYACTNQVSARLWKVKAKFTLADSYKTVNGFGWNASVTNTGADPIKDQQTVSGAFKDTVHPQVTLRIETYPPVSSPLTFSYSAGSPSLGTTVSGDVAQNVLPQSLAPCRD